MTLVPRAGFESEIRRAEVRGINIYSSMSKIRSYEGIYRFTNVAQARAVHNVPTQTFKRNLG